MASELRCEDRLKECLQLIIGVSLEVSSSFGRHAHNDQKINEFKSRITKILNEYIPDLPPVCENYLLNTLDQYEYDSKAKTFTKSFGKDTLTSFLKDLQGRLNLLDACQYAWNGDLVNVKHFIENFSSLKDKSGLYGTTILYSAARNNHMQLVKYLVEDGKCSVNAKNEDYSKENSRDELKATTGSTPLHVACYRGHSQIVKYLIKHGGDYFLYNALFETPIQNGRGNENIRNFFSDFLIESYSTRSSKFPNKTIREQIVNTSDTIEDCIWEHKSFSNDQWHPYQPDMSAQFYQHLSASLSDKFQNDIDFKGHRHNGQISLIKFLYFNNNNNKEIHNFTWIRCRGSALLNFHLFSQWQIMFTRHPQGVANSFKSIEVFDMSKNTIHLQTWYNVSENMNFLLETAVNYRRRFLFLNFDFINNELIKIDLEHFTFYNEQNTIEGYIRWIPKIVRQQKQLLSVDNFKTPQNVDLRFLTMSYLKEVEENGMMSRDEINRYELKYDNAFVDDNWEFSEQSISGKSLNKLINVVQGNLLQEKCDVIVICISSKYLYENVMRAGGKSFENNFYMTTKQNPKSSVFSVKSEGKLASKAVYFVSWHPDPDQNQLCRSIEKLTSNVIEKARNENYNTIAFPAIGCGEYGCSITLIAQTFVKTVQQELITSPMSVSFVIKPDRSDIYHEFHKQIQLNEHSGRDTSMSLAIDKGMIEVEQGDITKQKVDVIVGSTSSENLQKALLRAAGEDAEKAFEREYENNPNALIMSLPPGELPCRRLFFLKWEPYEDPDALQQSVVDLIWNVIQNVLSYKYTSIAFPAIGCGEHACSVDIVVETMVREMKQQMKIRKLPWKVKFVIESKQQNVYDEFCKQLLQPDEDSYALPDFKFPSTWEKPEDDNMRFIVQNNSDEYKSIVANFDQTMNNQYKKIIKIERIQNERWYMQYIAHSIDFKKRLQENTEKVLFHGCPETAADSIIADGFNRSFAGVNGIAYGVGVYFSSNASYSHGFTKPHSKGERCMFVARVLIGKTTLGNSSMKTRPLGFDSTTDGNSIFVTYHDAQAYAEYLIKYK